MDYTKVLTDLKRTKEVLTKKLDAIKTDVTNVNNSVTNLPSTLDTKFSALTSKVDGVKTDVASVGTKVDTAQTAISSKVDAVGANVTAMGAKVDGVQNTTTSLLKKNGLDEMAEIFRFQNFRHNITQNSPSAVFLDVSGSGCLYLVASRKDSNDIFLRLTIDDTVVFYRGLSGIEYVSRSYINPYKDILTTCNIDSNTPGRWTPQASHQYVYITYYTLPLSKTYVVSDRGKEERMQYGEPHTINNVPYLTENPLRFKKNIKLELLSKNISSAYAEAMVAYSLDQ